MMLIREVSSRQSDSYRLPLQSTPLILLDITEDTQAASGRGMCTSLRLIYNTRLCMCGTSSRIPPSVRASDNIY